ncbi:MAG: hypothetical protein JNL26_12680, partial [Gemmatimonadetes bacterium]|nr:hypothetical protein [Gemmatimonadota bacterium]
LFASQLLLTSVVLLALDARRLLDFLVFNRGAPATRAWDPPYSSARFTWSARAVKLLFFVCAFILPMQRGWQGFKNSRLPANPVPFSVGMYDVPTFVRGRDTIPLTLHDTLRWRDVAIDNTTGGSVGSTDPSFWQRYRRGYFRFRADTTARTLAVWRSSWTFDSTHIFTARYEVPTPGTVHLRTMVAGESLFVALRKSNRHYQLSERQFHWLSEYNR